MEQKKKMTKKVNEWCSKMEESTLPGYLKIESYKRRLWPQINYGLGLSQLKNTETKKIIAPLEKVVRRAFYLSSKFSSALLHLPEKFGGYGILCTHTQVIFEQEKILIGALRRDDNTGGKPRFSLNIINWRVVEEGHS